MPGLSVTLPQAQRLLGIDRETCAVVIRTLVDHRFLQTYGPGQVRSVLSRRSVTDTTARRVRALFGTTIG